MGGPLTGLTVLDFTWALAGPFGTMLLSDLGADVWKVETPFQNEARRGAGPYVHEVSTYFFSVNRGKKSIMLDLKAPEATEIVHRLVRQADILTENFSPGSMARLGFGYEQLREVNPRLIYASTSGFGQDGPYRNRGAVDVIIQGMSGLMSTTGHEADPLPSRAGYSIADMTAGMFTAIGVLSAVIERQSSGVGQHVDVAMLDSQIALLENPIMRYLATGEVQPRAGLRHPLVTPHQAFPAADGWFTVANVRDHNWQLFCGLIGADAAVMDPRFAKNADRTRYYDELEPMLFEALRKQPVAHWLEVLGDEFLVGPLNNVAQAADDPQVRHRGMIVDLPTWTGGSLQVTNTPVHLSRTPGGAEHGAPRPGEHTAELLAHVGYTEDEIASLLERGIVADGPAED